MTSPRASCRLAATVLWLAGLGVAPAAETNRTFITTVSASRQFTAHAPHALWSAALCAFGDRLRAEWLRQLDLPDAWRDPIVFVVHERAAGETNGPALVSEMFLIETRLKYQITCVVPPAIDETALTLATVEALCAELANREQPRVRGTPFVGAPIPLWLSTGLAGAVDGPTDRSMAIVRRSASGGRPPRATEIMQVTAWPADQAGRELYRANAWWLVESLREMPDGLAKMRRLLSELGAIRNAGRAFDAAFGRDFPDAVTLEKWWSLQQVHLSETGVAENLAAPETAQRLEALLMIEVEPRPAFDQLWRYDELPWMRPVLQNKLTGLSVLRTRAHPLYRPVIATYMEACGHLLEHRLSRFRRAVHQAARQRAAADQQVRQIRAELDRIEQTNAGSVTNAFEDFFRTLDRLQQFKQQRRNPISDYLDQFDK